MKKEKKLAKLSPLKVKKHSVHHAKKHPVIPIKKHPALKAKKHSSHRQTRPKAHHKENKRVPTGIPNFDELMEGGFERNSTNMIVGGSGSGKSILATQFLVEGMKHGEKCLYVTFEEKKKQFYDNMLEFGWDLVEYERKGLFMFLEYTPIKVKTMLEEGGGTIESFVLSHKITRIVIDSITSFALLFEDELSRREAALSLFNMIKKWSCTSLLTSEEEPTGDKKLSSKSLEFESDSIILLYFVREKNQRQRYLEILKMRGTKHSKKIYGFEITRSGIVVEKNPPSNIQIDNK